MEQDQQKPSDLFTLDVWSLVLQYLSLKDKLSCRQVCTQLKTQVESVVKRQDKLWVRNRLKNQPAQCFDPDHVITDFDSVSFSHDLRVKDLQVLSCLMPNLKVVRVDPIVQNFTRRSRSTTFLGTF